MRYVISDIHGEYDLFVKLLDRIGFSSRDELYVCGDIIEKGRDSIKLARLIFSMPNAYVIMGNHEHAFIQYYRFLMKERACNSDADYDAILGELKKYITDSGSDGELLDWSIVDSLDRLPYYIEADDFICVHAGIPLNAGGELPPLDSVPCEELIHNRSFKEPEVIPRRGKCVFFGHTATAAVIGEDSIVGYKRHTGFGDIRDFVKVHLDTCTCVSGVLGCFCIDTCEVSYVKRGK